MPVRFIFARKFGSAHTSAPLKMIDFPFPALIPHRLWPAPNDQSLAQGPSSGLRRRMGLAIVRKCPYISPSRV
jgi:hypothetical protein